MHNDRWKKDEEFGRQVLNGINPVSIEKVRQRLPENFPLTDLHVNGLLCRGVSLNVEISMGNIYIINHKVLPKLNHKILEYICILYIKTK